MAAGQWPMRRQTKSFSRGNRSKKWGAHWGKTAGALGDRT